MKFEKKDRYLLITGEGEKKDLKTLTEGSKKILQAILENECTRVLADYRKAYFNMHQTNAFNVIRFYEAKLPSFADVAVAVVINNQSKEISMVWTDVAQQRGFNFKVFTDFDKAEQWLLSN